MMKKTSLLLLLLLFAQPALAQRNTPQSYIEKYKDDAIRIMYLTGVPASIVLGIAMHESACGNSFLARTLNNQFGFKGNSRITYKKHHKRHYTIYKKYDSVTASFNDFARMITQKKKFCELAQKYSRWDFEGWAHAIQHCGYAADRRWAKGVLACINKYQLFQFDGQDATNISPADSVKLDTGAAILNKPLM